MSTFLDQNGFQENDDTQILQLNATATGNGNTMLIRGMEAVLINVAGLTTATIIIEVQDAANNWNQLTVINALNGNQASSITANGLYSVVFVGMVNLRARISAYTAGTINVNAAPVQLNVGGIESGSAASGATDTGNPVKVGGKYNATAPTFSDGQRADLQMDANGNLKITQATLLAGEDLTNNKMVVEQRNSYATISTATTTTVKSGAGFVHCIEILGGTLGTITVYDNVAGSGTTICPTFTPTATLPCPAIILDESFSTGLTIVTGSATILNISYR